jgi:hypothetical protein
MIKTKQLPQLVDLVLLLFEFSLLLRDDFLLVFDLYLLLPDCVDRHWHQTHVIQAQRALIVSVLQNEFRQHGLHVLRDQTSVELSVRRVFPLLCLRSSSY